MKTVQSALLIVTLSTLLLIPKVFAADSGTVAATVTAQNISLSVSDGTISYGILAVSTTKATVNLAPVDTQTVTNDGNVTEQFNIKGTDSADWTLESAVGPNQYVHKFCASSCATPPTNYTALSEASYATLAASVVPAGTQSLDLEISTPSSSTVFTSQNVNVVVQAVLP
ncbi:MAG: hypothetical protein RBS01_04060 [Candidatus Dojkabacteria bacterium]|jgi:hypothetical protein|nr:hypothetical protein [Candidatus Dojkabacteria bacterium]